MMDMTILGLDSWKAKKYGWWRLGWDKHKIKCVHQM